MRPAPQALGEAHQALDPSPDAPFLLAQPQVAGLGALPAASPLYDSPPAPRVPGEEPALGYVGRTESAIGWGLGSYALNSQDDLGVAAVDPDRDLPGLRDGGYRFSRRALGAGDQAALDDVLRAGGNYQDIAQPEYQHP